MEVLDSLVIGAGQAGLSASYHLTRRGIDHVVLDADRSPGGAWQHRWDSLTMHDVHGIAELPGAERLPLSDERANLAVPAYFTAYERLHDLPVVRPVAVDRVESTGPSDGEPRRDGLLVTYAGDRNWVSRTLVNATGTWSHPYVPYYPGIGSFRGEQLHTHDYPGPEHFRGRRTVVVGAGASAVQLLGEIALVTDVLWVTRRPPVWRTTEFSPEAGSAAVALVEDRVRRGLPPQSVVSVTGLMLRPQEEAARRLGVYDRRLPMFASIEPDGVRWPDGRFDPVDVILWATGFRPAIGHLAPLRLRGPAGGIQLDRHGTTVVVDPRVQLVGYGPSASTIGANRAGRAAARGVAAWLAGHPAPSVNAASVDLGGADDADEVGDEASA
ncbi:FAD-dependent oxidoreductase [Nocardioides cheoyonin]|uniref:FAD-dependent oxidoreductase n=1 Tax=Nocardioides cheoyonin TaxID=3156615 RepID=UPI0032B35867